QANVRQIKLWLLRGGNDEVTDRQVQLDELSRRLLRAAPTRQIDLARQRLDESEERIRRILSVELRRRKEQLDAAIARLEGLNPSSVLSRGYSIVQRGSGAVVSAPEQTSAGERLVVRSAGGDYPVIRETD
ncbi:MAG: hypothetical protein OXI52_10125, partial [Caldilineaceae bacterium]|nr:hypothetical protein [Caldilineaceae bacterium]